MAVAFDSVTESTIQTGTSITQSHTCTCASYLIVAVHHLVNGQPAPSSVKAPTAPGSASVTLTWTGASGFRSAHAAVSIDPPVTPPLSLAYSVPSVDFRIKDQVTAY